MVVCKFYQQGNCRFGNNCRNEHPGNQSGSGSNSFGALGGSGDRYRPGGARDGKRPAHGIDKQDIMQELTTQRPIYPLSCFGTGRDAPRQLIEGPVEISPDELRFRYYSQAATGNEQTAQQEETELAAKMEQQVKAIVDDIDGAIRYVEEGANVHPNRQDIISGKASASGSGSSSNPFQQTPNASSNPFSTAPAQSSTFGKPSAPGFGQPAFGQSAFGQPSNPGQTTSAFGQPSNPGQTSAFGTASNLGQKPNPFGQASSAASGSTFGKPAFGASGFGQPSMPGSGSAFGQANSMGSQPAFGQASAPNSGSAFGQANALGGGASAFGKPAFGQTGFGQTAPASSSASPFGQQSQTNASPFGQQTQANASPFGQQAQANTSPFGQQTQANASPFGQQAQQGASASPFGQQAQSTQQPNPFAQAQSSQQSPAQPNPFGGAAASTTPAFGQPSAPAFGAPSLSTQSQSATAQAANPFSQAPATSASAGVSAFGQAAQNPSPFGQPQPQSQAQPQAEIVFREGYYPNGNPIDQKDRSKEGKPEEYEGERGRGLEEIYKRVALLGLFKEGENIPLTPPKCEWIVDCGEGFL